MNCSRAGAECYQQQVFGRKKKNSDSCLKPCHGLHADISVERKQDTITLEQNPFTELLLEYQLYKNGNVANYTDYFEEITCPGWPFKNYINGCNGCGKCKQKLQVIEIYIATPTFDKITLDAKTNIETMISTVGGTLGLFTGFSLLSAVEILYWILKTFKILLVTEEFLTAPINT